MGSSCTTGLVAIIDDDESVRTAIHGVLESVGFSAVCFSRAQEFLASNKIDDSACVITDLKMPGMTGLELQERLARDGRRIPVIFVTAYGEERARASALKAGAAAFLDKPFNDDALIEIVRTAVNPSV